MPQPMADEQQQRQPALSPGEVETPPAAPVLNYAGIAAPLRMATVATYGDVAEAHLACSALARAEINALIDGENVAANVHGYAPVLGVLKLRVEEEHLAHARQVLDEIAAKRSKWSRYESQACPACGSKRIRRTRLRRVVGTTLVLLGVLGCALDETRAIAVAALIVGGYILITPEYARYRCDACGHRWHPSEQDDQDDEGEGADGREDDGDDAEETPPSRPA